MPESNPSISSMSIHLTPIWIKGTQSLQHNIFLYPRELRLAIKKKKKPFLSNKRRCFVPSQKCTKPDSPNAWFWICLSRNKCKPSAAAAAWLVSQSLQRAISFPAWTSTASLLQAFRQRILIMSHSAVTEATLLLWWAACWEGLHAPSLSFYRFFYLFFCIHLLPPKCLVY